MEHKRPKTHIIAALIAITASTFFSASIGAIVKYAPPGLTIEAMTFWRNLVCLILILPWLKLSSPRTSFLSKIKTKQFPRHLIRSVSGLAAVFLLFLSLQYLSLSNAMLLANTVPIFLPFVAYFWKKLPILHNLWWGIGIAFGGMIVIMEPSLGAFEWASLIALAASICGSIAVFALRQSHFSEPPVRTLFYYFLIASLIAGLMTLPRFTENWLSLTQENVWILIGIGGLGMALQVSFTFATKWAPVRQTSPLLYMSVIFGMLLQWYITKEPIATSTILGFVLVFIGAMLVLFLYPKEKL